MAAATAAAASLGFGVADGQTGAEVGVIDVLHDTFLQSLLGLLVYEERETAHLELGVPLVLLLLEGHAELRAGTSHSSHVDLDSMVLLVVLIQKFQYEFLCIRSNL